LLVAYWVAAARRKFSSEFLNRFDKIVVFNALSAQELRRILDTELEAVHGRIEAASQGSRTS
jgi:ATP-dependent Clp protease ATP-binding subunit ClpA